MFLFSTESHEVSAMPDVIIYKALESRLTHFHNLHAHKSPPVHLYPGSLGYVRELMPPRAP